MPRSRLAFRDYQARLADATAGRQRVVAFFDLDRTLIDGYSLTALALQQLSNGRLPVRRLVSLATMFLGYSLGRKDYAQMLQATVDDIRGMPEDELFELGRQAYDARMGGWVYQESFDLVGTHRRLGHDVVMVTSATR